ncbi:ATP phosphoribosyltransferase [Candidatus Methylacidithermus pantelleriae]|uniref:ATP phosphoribosyltransferase n=1 Tax=Candidatus Methylacidithermus pantelleriae TaxID=2744239 RepID=A0A8J2BP96_9BACT|nr:ATP phosphoribosyltransferase [Candidatus Methylacidithermus pantelleriae]CAF0703732.1 ATP phosphoribosyltransferase [Candidatus Methylacidithermus pantelleriae]
MSCERKLRIGLPKGSLEEATVELLAKAGFRLRRSQREYRPYIDDPDLEARLIRAQELARYVAQGFLDCGITGKDWVLETEADVVVICDLAYSKASKLPARWVLAVAEDSPYRSVHDLAGKRIATEAVQLVRKYLRTHGVEAQVEFSWGATEVKVPELVDAIVDLTETGASLRANNLRVLDVVLESYPQWIANPVSWKDEWKRKKMEAIAILLQGALQARDKVGLKMNVPQSNLNAILQRLPALRRPTISQLADPQWVAVETVLDEEIVRVLIPELKELGAEGIIEYPLNKVIY